jgi:hypothetical protein
MSTTGARRRLRNGRADTVNGGRALWRVHGARQVLRAVSARMREEEGKRVLGG